MQSVTPLLCNPSTPSIHGSKGAACARWGRIFGYRKPITQERSRLLLPEALFHQGLHGIFSTLLWLRLGVYGGVGEVGSDHFSEGALHSDGYVVNPLKMRPLLPFRQGCTFYSYPKSSEHRPASPKPNGNGPISISAGWCSNPSAISRTAGSPERLSRRGEYLWGRRGCGRRENRYGPAAIARVWLIWCVILCGWASRGSRVAWGRSALYER